MTESTERSLFHLQDLLTRHKGLVAMYLVNHYDEVRSPLSLRPSTVQTPMTLSAILRVLAACGYDDLGLCAVL